MATIQKKRAVVSYEKMNPELSAAFTEKYPKGYSDYFQDLVRFDKPDGTYFYAVAVEIPDAIYLVKINVKEDDPDEVNKWLTEGDDGADGDEGGSGASESGGESLPDDNISQYSAGADDEGDA